VIVTNQAGVEAGKVKVSDLETKFGLIQGHLKIPMIFFAALRSDQFRKPAVGGWEYIKNQLFSGCKINIAESFYCGDAAGRPKTATRPKDFSDTDIKFAHNIGLSFKTPEEFFLDQK
jgi:bifunctional polynucleotide phosphatase/kinase